MSNFVKSFIDLVKFGKEPLRFMVAKAREGDFVELRFPFVRKQFLLSDPKLIEQVLTRENRHFIKYKRRSILFDRITQSTLISDGEDWRRRKQLTMKAVADGREEFRLLIQKQTSLAVDKLAQNFNVGKMPTPLSFISGICTHVAFEFFLGKSMRDLALEEEDTLASTLRMIRLTQAEFSQTHRAHFRALYKRLPSRELFAFEKNYRHWRRIFDLAIAKEIKKQKKQGVQANTNKSLLAHLITDLHGDKPAFSQSGIVDELFIWFFAFADLSVSSIFWCIYLLSQNKRAQEDLFNETQKFKSRDSADYEIEELIYANAICHEALRLYPPQWIITREAKQDLTLGEQKIKKGEFIYMCPYIVQRLEKFFPQADKFKPERWLHLDRPPVGRARSPMPRFIYFPFGGGERECSGRVFALDVMLIFVREFISRFQIISAESYHPKIMPYLNILPAEEGEFVLKLRSKQRKRPSKQTKKQKSAQKNSTIKNKLTAQDKNPRCPYH